jgi:RNA ligase (TIGR02306 family)
MSDEKLAYIGKIIELKAIPNADFIVAATVVCGQGGKWRGIVNKNEYSIGNKCIVYLPESVIPENEEMAFMAKHKWRVKQMRFKGVASECLIMPLTHFISYGNDIGYDCTKDLDVKRFFKPIPANLACDAIGLFPYFVPKTDEPNYQSVLQLVELLQDKPYIITEKCDGSSTTAFKKNNHFGVCSRNFELKPKESNGYWQIVRKYKLEERLPKDFAVQWETCGPGIQSNPMGLKEIDGFAFNVYDIKADKYLNYTDFYNFVLHTLKMPIVRCLEIGQTFDKSKIEIFSEYFYDENNKFPIEGIVIRSQDNLIDNRKPISFKVINLNYEN